MNLPFFLIEQEAAFASCSPARGASSFSWKIPCAPLRFKKSSSKNGTALKID